MYQRSTELDELKNNKSLVQCSINRTKLWSMVVYKIQTVVRNLKIKIIK